MAKRYPQISEIQGYTERFLFTQEGVLATGAGQLRYWPGVPGAITQVWAHVGTAPTGAAIRVDVNKSGTTIYTDQNQRPNVAVSTNFALGGTIGAPGTFSSTDITNRAYITVDVDAVGSTVAGSDLVIGVVYTPASP